MIVEAFSQGLLNISSVQLAISIIIVCIIISFVTQLILRRTYRKYSSISNSEQYTGYNTARLLLDQEGLGHIKIEMTGTVLGDNYDQITKVLKLSRAVYSGFSIASIGIATYHVGHAIQHQSKFAPVILRSIIVQSADTLTYFALGILLIGGMSQHELLFNCGIILFISILAVQILTLPVAFNSSSRSLKVLEMKALLNGEELKGVKRILEITSLADISKMHKPIMKFISGVSKMFVEFIRHL